jgi:hypothetical protein
VRRLGAASEIERSIELMSACRSPLVAPGSSPNSLPGRLRRDAEIALRERPRTNYGSSTPSDLLSSVLVS